ncbi:MAG: FHA domain-containing protein [Myxococcales bacterium FL481]|nr:MAG: FHA domain-containing protein [Myxococcales bacterium FL481]
MDLGLACPVCGQLNVIRAVRCSRCGNELAPAPVGAAVGGEDEGRVAEAVAVPAAGAIDDPPSGASAGGAGGHAKTMFFGALQQQEVSPRLVVIKGEGADGLTYQLSGETQILGRTRGDLCFAEDPFLSPEHGRFTVQGGRLFVQDLNSTNGIFVRIRAPSPIEHDDLFLVGEQLLQLDARGFAEYMPDHRGTYFYGSPRVEAEFRVTQRLAGGGLGLSSAARGSTLTIGREGNVLNFPEDRFISGHHAQLHRPAPGGPIVLSDTGSRNGTYVRIKRAQELFHGDYLFVGQQLFRVEIA